MAAAVQVTMKTYHHLVEALAVQRRLGCSDTAQAADIVRRMLIAQMGLERFLGCRLNSHSGEPAEGWVVEFEHGRQRFCLQGRSPLLQAAKRLIEEEYGQRNRWPTGIRRGTVFIEL
ncbi:MAG: hypothetical protein QXU79_02305 [Candidatus Micrarchaeaceae archaeon]